MGLFNLPLLLPHLPSSPAPLCAWWNLACKGGDTVANAGLNAITRSIASGAEMLLSQIVLTIDESSAVPLSDPTYRHLYYGFLGLAVPLIGVVLCGALIVAAIRRDPTTLARAVTGIGVATLGGAFYIVFAQLLVAIDDYLSHGVVRITGYNLTSSISQIAVGFHHIAGTPGDLAANMLLILLMLIMLVSGLMLWFVLVLRKIATLVVVAFAPFLIVGYLWAPTRAWVSRATEVLVALVFTKTAIFTLFGIGLALLSRGTDQSLSDFVGTVILMCGACFAPFVMLRLVHFAGNTHLATDAMGTLRGGVRPVTDRLGSSAGAGGGGGGAVMGRSDFARSQAEAPQDPAALGPDPATASSAGASSPAGASAGASSSGAAGAGAAAAGAGVAGAAVAAAQAAHEQGHAAVDGTVAAGQSLASPPPAAAAAAAAEVPDRPLAGPDPAVLDHRPDHGPEHGHGHGPAFGDQ